MMDQVPAYVSLVFGVCVICALLFVYAALRGSGSETVRKKTGWMVAGLVLWLALQTVLSLKGVYHSTPDALPPRIFVFGVLPPLLGVLLLFLLPSGRRFIDSLPLQTLTWLHTVRIPVETVLFWLFTAQTVPQLMTFEGRNFDILAGLTAPLVAYFGFAKKRLGRSVLLGWNIVCLGLLFNIVLHAFFSAPSPLQKLAFDQPNMAILYFPFSLLPAFIVPAVLLSHLTAIRQLSKKDKTGLES